MHSRKDLLLKGLQGMFASPGGRINPLIRKTGDDDSNLDDSTVIISAIQQEPIIDLYGNN